MFPIVFRYLYSANKVFLSTCFNVFQLFSGPVASYLMRRMSYRKVAVIGSLLSTIGLLVIPFLNNIILLYAVYGVLVGLGFAMAYLPSSVLAGLYFEKHRSLASGVVTSGSGLGQTVFQMLCHVLIQHYGWKGSLFILAGLMLQCLVCATLLFPLPPKASKEEAALILNENCHIKQVLNGRNATDVNSEQSEIELKKDSNGICLTEISETYQPNGCSSEAAIMLQENNPKIDSNHSSTTSTQQCNILSDFNFQVFFWNNLLWNMGIAISWVLAPEYIVKMGLTKANAATIMTLGGFGCFIGCIIGGGLGNIQRFSRLYMYIMWNLGTGVSIMLMTVKVFQTVAALSCIMFVNGIAFGGVLGLLVIFTVDLLGEKVLGDAFGYLMLSNGLGSIIGPPLGGKYIK